MKKLFISASASGTQANIRIIGTIREWGDASSREFRRKVDGLIKNGAKDCHCYINSGGGDVFEAAEFVNIIKSFPGKITGTGGAMVASAATYIAAHLDEFYLMSNSRVMIHKPKGRIEGTEDEIINKLALLKSVTTEYRELYAEKMNTTAEAVESIWAKGDKWYTATQAEAAGLCHKVLSKRAKVDAKIAASLEAEGCPEDYLPKSYLPIKKIEKMDTGIYAVQLGLSTDASQDDISKEIKRLKDLEVKSQSVIAEATRVNEAAKKKRVESLVDAAIKDKKFAANQRDNYIAFAQENFDAAKSAIDAMSSVKKIDLKKFEKKITNRQEWTYAEWLEKDPEGLDVLRTNEEDEFQQLVDAHYAD